MTVLEPDKGLRPVTGPPGILAKGQLPLTALRAFEAAARNLNITRAAVELGVTQGAVSQQVRRLEELIGAPLFDRSYYKLRLTHQGELLAGALGSAFGQIGAALSAVSQGGFADQTLRLRMYPIFASKIVVPRLPRFQAAFPDIEVQLTMAARSPDLAEDPVDVSVREGVGGWPGTRWHHCLSQILIPVCGSKLLDRRPIGSVEDLSRVTLLHSTDRPDDWASWLLSMKLSHREFLDEVRLANSEMAYAAAAAGEGVAIAQFALVHDELREGRLVAPLAHAVRQNRSYLLVVPDDRASVPAIAAFQKWMLAEMSVLEGELDQALVDVIGHRI